MRSACWMVGVVVLSTAGVPGAARAVEPAPPVDAITPAEGAELPIESFTQPLSAFGEWLTLAGLGRVWRPSTEIVGPAFRPYRSAGHWVFTDAGWTFVSDYAWGWATFHYGHWWRDAANGWVWLPGPKWAPAWVDWRYGGGHVGWAPAAPPGVEVALNAPGESPWCFIATRYVGSRTFGAHLVPAAQARAIYNVTRPAPVATLQPGQTYSPGPPASHFTAAGLHLDPVAAALLAPVMPPPGLHATAFVPPRAGNPVVPRPSTTVSPEVQAESFSAAESRTRAPPSPASGEEEPATPAKSANAAHPHHPAHAPPRAAAHAPRHAAAPAPRHAAAPAPRHAAAPAARHAAAPARQPPVAAHHAPAAPQKSAAHKTGQHH